MDEASNPRHQRMTQQQRSALLETIQGDVDLEQLKKPYLPNKLLIWPKQAGTPPSSHR